MVTDFIQEYAKLIVSNPQRIEVTSNKIDENFYEITIYCDEDDFGKLIGKNGNMINALRAIVNGCKAKDGNSYRIQLLQNRR